MDSVEKLIRFIETPETNLNERDKAISQLNLLGVENKSIEEMAYTFWQEYFAKNMTSILEDRIVLISHLLPDDLFKQCFNELFKEFQDRKKQMGIDDIRKFWAP